MLFQSNQAPAKSSGLEKLSAAATLAAGLLATVYFGYKLTEIMLQKYKQQGMCHCGCEDEPVAHEYDHYSENDSLCHEKKDYYHTCGCFDTEDGNPPICDDKDVEETV